MLITFMALLKVLCHLRENLTYENVVQNEHFSKLMMGILIKVRFLNRYK